MDNITHSLVGVAVADAIAGGRAVKVPRSLVAGAGLIAANLPDIDLAYSAMTPAPLGYLLHHRGHTHTIVGVAVLALALVLAYGRVPSVRSMRPAERLRLWVVIAAALGSHLAMDALNSYGVHPWYPFDNRWYYGDAVFIFEPALWLILGAAAAWNGRSGLARLGAAAPAAVLVAGIAVLGIVPVESLVVLALAGAAFSWAARRRTPAGRAWLALGATALMLMALFAVSREARAESRRVLQPHLRGRLVDVVLTPNPSAPWCWSVIGIEAIEARGEYVLWRGTLTLVPSLKAATACASHRLAGTDRTRIIAGGRFALRDEIHRPLRQLRELSRDCWVGAWLRFGRAPVVAGGEIFDLRFAERGAAAFTHMALVREPGEPRCPAFVPPWGMPRHDLLAR